MKYLLNRSLGSFYHWASECSFSVSLYILVLWVYIAVRNSERPLYISNVSIYIICKSI